MSSAESRSVRTAALVLVVVASIRWAADHRPLPGSVEAGAPDDASGVLDGLAAETAEAAGEGARRALPLAAGERIDPNRADEIELDRLPGVGPATAAAILAARDAGAVFRRPEDLVTVRGIGPTLAARLEPHLDFGRPPSGRRTVSERVAAAARLDLNRADVASLQALPGIGPALADRIVEARRQRPFADVDDLQRVAGIGPATVDRLRPLVTVGATR